jgi:hypothetical protein
MGQTASRIILGAAAAQAMRCIALIEQVAPPTLLWT